MMRRRTMANIMNDFMGLDLRRSDGFISILRSNKKK